MNIKKIIAAEVASIISQDKGVMDSIAELTTVEHGQVTTVDNPTDLHFEDWGSEAHDESTNPAILLEEVEEARSRALKLAKDPSISGHLVHQLMDLIQERKVLLLGE